MSEAKLGTKYPEIQRALVAQFTGDNEVKTRQGSRGRMLSYITARTAMNRLDEVFGGENWGDDYIPLACGVMCRLWVRYPNGEVVTKCDAGGNAGMEDLGDNDKSGFSDALKRAAVKFGVGRYLYNDGVPDNEDQDERPDRESSSRDDRYERREIVAPSREDDEPKTGRELFKWVKGFTDHHPSQFNMFSYMKEWGIGRDLPARIVDWPPEAIPDAMEFALDMVATIESPNEPEPKPSPKRALASPKRAPAKARSR